MSAPVKAPCTVVSAQPVRTTEINGQTAFYVVTNFRTNGLSPKSFKAVVRGDAAVGLVYIARDTRALVEVTLADNQISFGAHPVVERIELARVAEQRRRDADHLAAFSLPH